MTDRDQNQFLHAIIRKGQLALGQKSRSRQDAVIGTRTLNCGVKTTINVYSTNGSEKHMGSCKTTASMPRFCEYAGKSKSDRP